MKYPSEQLSVVSTKVEPEQESVLLGQATQAPFYKLYPVKHVVATLFEEQVTAPPGHTIQAPFTNE
jgi:hypothetical protein